MALHLLGAGSEGRETGSDQRECIISYACFGCSYGLSTGWTGQNGVELSRDVALQTADDLGLGLSLSGPPLHVGAGGCMPGHPADRDQVQRRARLAVAATAQPMAGGLAG